MTRSPSRVSFVTAFAIAVAGAMIRAVHPSAGSAQDSSAGSRPGQQEESRFRGGVELVNVTATVTDDHGQFVSGLRQEDFLVYEDNQPQTVSHFSNERVPVSLGIAFDTSGSMTSDKMSSARGAISRFFDLLGPDDEIFLYRFATVPELVQDWTSDRPVLSRAL
ncbi:MAG: VWA domain-containing protein, partial [Acidobacteria bacterium]|nr:VWA domain-containing protein [Acidobacteriota bacterium]